MRDPVSGTHADRLRAPLAADRFVPAAEIRRRLEGAFALTPLACKPGRSSRDFMAEDRHGRRGIIGFISSETEPFCVGCTRLRLTSTGEVIGCLSRGRGISVRRFLRSSQDERVAAAIRRVVADKGRRPDFRTGGPWSQSEDDREVAPRRRGRHLPGADRRRVLADQPETGDCREPLTVLAAASLADALPEIGDAFERAHGRAVQFDFASSGILRAKIEAGARADLFIAASSAEMDKLQASGRVRAEDRQDLLTNRLVCVVPARSAVSMRAPADLDTPVVRRIAIGDPAHVPAGQYAQEALRHMGLWERLRDRLVPSADVRAALAQAESGAVDAAIVYRTDAAAAGGVRVAFEFPEGSHAPIRYPVACLADAPHPAAAQDFLAFLTSPQSSAVFSSYGFTPVAAPAAAAELARPSPAPAWNGAAAEALRRSLRVSLIATLLMVLAGAPIALWLARRKGCPAPRWKGS